MGGQFGGLPSGGDRFDNVRGQEGERQQAADVPIADSFDRREFGDTTDLSRDERLEAAMSSPDLLQQDWIGISRNRGQPLDNEPHLHPAAMKASPASRCAWSELKSCSRPS